MKKLLLISLIFGNALPMETENTKLALEAAVIVGGKTNKSPRTVSNPEEPIEKNIIYNTNETHCHGHSSDEEDRPGKTCCSQKTQVVIALAVIGSVSTIISSTIAATVSLITHFAK